jgi:heme/copper-type cytochrome/quinol oxidase subunit 2
MKGAGAIVFLVVFALFLAISLGYTSLPPGRQLYSMLGVPETDYPTLGIPTTTLVISVFNGIVYGVIAWLIYTVADRSRKPKKQEPPKQEP